MLNVKQITFYAKTRSKNGWGWNGTGQGEVISSKEEPNKIIFHEKGTWQNNQGMIFNFHNVFRWTLNCHADIISLEHLRRGPKHPVFLLQLTPANKYCLKSVDSHLCAEDTYVGQIHIDKHCLRLDWIVIGPKKNEELSYYYF